MRQPAISVERARAELAQLGFTKLERVLALPDMARIEGMIDALVARAQHSPEISWRAMFSATAVNEPSHLEVYRPALLNKAVQDSPVFQRCQQLASQLLGRWAYYLFDHAIYKQPLSHSGVHWHQDQAYLGASLAIRAVHFWIPFQDVDASSGCLRFAPSSDHGHVWPHASAYDAHPHILRAEIAEPATIFDQPMKLGDISVHTNFTLHSSWPNRTERTRKAWIIHFGDRPRWWKHVLRVGAQLSRRKSLPVGSA